jgi:hypothetical protein
MRLKKKRQFMDEIQDSIDDDKTLTMMKKLVQLKKEVEAVEEFIGTVGNARK